MKHHFISDLHLERGRPGVADGFCAYLAEVPGAGDALYILGDLFEVWLGDDDLTPFHERMIAAMAQVSARGIALHIMHGNRDFLLGEAFCKATGARLLADPTVIQCNGRNVLLMHGDSLCTRDLEYMKVRAMLRDPAFQQQFLQRSLEERAAFAANARLESKEHTAAKAMEIMDVTPDEVARVMREAGVDLLVHGHTHRPRVHALDLDGHAATRVVLGDWTDRGWALEFGADGYHLRSFALAESAPTGMQ